MIINGKALRGNVDFLSENEINNTINTTWISQQR